MEEKEGMNLIDVSSENDLLIGAHVSSSTLPPQSPGADGGDEKDLSNGFGGQLPHPFETAEPSTFKKTGKYNLRKSLAWDTAFFESPGFLDADDISTMIDGAEKGKQHILPGIDEDITKSTDSISTLLGENLTLETLEAELFKDIRASIQKSSKASEVSNSNHKAAARDTNKATRSSLKKVDVTSRNRIAMQGSGRIFKKDSSFPLATEADLRNSNSTSSLSQSPKVITKPGPMGTVTTKRASLGVNRTRTETNNSKVGVKRIQVPKAAGLPVPRRGVPKPASFSEVSSTVSSGASIKEIGRFSLSSNNSCNSNSSKKVHKFLSTSSKTKTEVKPVAKASSKVPSRKKPSGKSGLSSSLMLSKISSSISPSSSISEWSSASSSTPIANQRLTSRTSTDTNTQCFTENKRVSARTSLDTNSSSRSMDNDTPSVLSSDVQSNGNMSDGNMNLLKEFSTQDAKRTSAQSSVLSRSALTKPSGLRMPSPKIGFFDGAKSVVRTPSGCRQSQSHLPTILPKIGAAIRSPDGSWKKAEEKIPPGEKAAAVANTVLNTSKFASAKLSQEPMTSMKVHSAHRSVSSPCVSSEVRCSNKATGKQRPEAANTNIELEGPQVASPKPSQEPVPGVSPEVHFEMDGSNCLKTEDVKFGKPDGTKHATANAPKAENDENLLLNI